MGKSRRSGMNREATGAQNQLGDTVLGARVELVMEAGFRGARVAAGAGQSILVRPPARTVWATEARTGMGYDEGSLVVDGRRVKVNNPRARSVHGEELRLPHWKAFKAADLLVEGGAGADPERRDDALIRSLAREAARRGRVIGHELIERLPAVNVLGHLPRHIRPWFGVKIRKAWSIDNAAA